MSNSQTKLYNIKTKEYINWIINILNSEPSKMITEKTYATILNNGSCIDKSNLLQLNKFANELNLYASNNYINTFNQNIYDLEYSSHFSLVLKVDTIFLLIEYGSSTHNSYTFISIINACDNIDYIDWDLYSRNRRPQKIERLMSKLDSLSSKLNDSLKDIFSSDLFEDSGLSNDEQKELISKFIFNNFHLD